VYIARSSPMRPVVPQMYEVPHAAGRCAAGHGLRMRPAYHRKSPRGNAGSEARVEVVPGARE